MKGTAAILFPRELFRGKFCGLDGFITDLFGPYGLFFYGRGLAPFLAKYEYGSPLAL